MLFLFLFFSVIMSFLCPYVSCSFQYLHSIFFLMYCFPLYSDSPLSFVLLTLFYLVLSLYSAENLFPSILLSCSHFSFMRFQLVPYFLSLLCGLVLLTLRTQSTRSTLKLSPEEILKTVLPLYNEWLTF